MNKFLTLTVFFLLSGLWTGIRAGEKQSVIYESGDSLSYAVRTVGDDSASIAEIRARMDSIRRHRPTVALVLSGGGAKGAAHIGAIAYLESIGMPVDMVLGTSMGGLVGGIYALGYSIGELEAIVRSIDWDLALSDRIPMEFISK